MWPAAAGGGSLLLMILLLTMADLPARGRLEGMAGAHRDLLGIPTSVGGPSATLPEHQACGGSRSGAGPAGPGLSNPDLRRPLRGTPRVDKAHLGGRLILLTKCCTG